MTTIHLYITRFALMRRREIYSYKIEKNRNKQKYFFFYFLINKMCTTHAYQVQSGAISIYLLELSTYMIRSFCYESAFRVLLNVNT